MPVNDRTLFGYWILHSATGRVLKDRGMRTLVILWLDSARLSTQHMPLFHVIVESVSMAASSMWFINEALYKLVLPTRPPLVPAPGVSTLPRQWQEWIWASSLVWALSRDMRSKINALCNDFQSSGGCLYTPLSAAGDVVLGGALPTHN